MATILTGTPEDNIMKNMKTSAFKSRVPVGENGEKEWMLEKLETHMYRRAVDCKRCSGVRR
jgi:hypothetical protein